MVSADAWDGLDDLLPRLAQSSIWFWIAFAALSREAETVKALTAEALTVEAQARKQRREANLTRLSRSLRGEKTRVRKAA